MAEAFRNGLAEIGYVEARNVVIEYHWTEGQTERFPIIAPELARRAVSVIVAIGTVSAQAAKAATTTVPIVFVTGDDPVIVGLVASLSRPGANVTGLTFITSDPGSKTTGAAARGGA